MQSTRQPQFRYYLYGAMVLAIVVGLLQFLARPSSPGVKTSVSVASTSLGTSLEKRAIDPNLRTLKQIFALAHEEAKLWRADAKMIRFYVGDAANDGSVEPLRVSAQAVFLSPGLSGQGETINALRWQLEAGKTSNQPISKYPAPVLTFPDAVFCDIAKVGGVDTPPRVGVDLSYVSDGDREPLLSVFAKSPKWLAVADPFRCEVKGRTEKELKGPSEIGDSGEQEKSVVPFDREKAHEVLRGALSDIARCKGGSGPHGPGLLTVLFGQSGKVQTVDFRSEGFSGTPAGECIEKLVRKVEIPPWNSGRGYVATKFVLD